MNRLPACLLLSLPLSLLAQGGAVVEGTVSDKVPAFEHGQFRTITHLERVPAGRYRILPGVGGAPGFYAAAVLVDGRDVSGQDVELTASSVVSVVYKPNPGSIHGTVEKGDGAQVLLWPREADIPYAVPRSRAR